MSKVATMSVVSKADDQLTARIMDALCATADKEPPEDVEGAAEVAQECKDNGVPFHGYIDGEAALAALAKVVRILIDPLPGNMRARVLQPFLEIVTDTPIGETIN